MPRLVRSAAPCLTFFAIAVSCLLGGCGGGETPVATGKGALKVKVVWPQVAKGAAKMIPQSSLCVKIDVYDFLVPESASKQTPLQTILVARPEGGGAVTKTLDIAVGSYSITATAHGTADASDWPQAIGASEELVVELNKTTPCNLTLTGTVTTITLSPPSVYLFGIGDSEPLTITATDASENIVMLSPGQGTWNMSQTGIVSVSDDGYVTAEAAYGYVTLSYTDTEHGVQSNDVYANVINGY